MSRENQERKALKAAAAGPREECRQLHERIRRDLRTGHDPDSRPARLERVFAYVEEHLYEPSLSIGGACRAAGVKDPEIGGALQDYSAYTLGRFLEKIRVDTANRLLVDTRVKTVTIGHLVGFRTYSTFLRVYKARRGETAHATRERHGIDPYAGVPFDFGNVRELRRMSSGELGTDEAGALREGLEELYPEVFGVRGEPSTEPTPAPAVPSFDAEALERFQATELWPRLAGLPFAEQRRVSSTLTT